MTWLAWMLDDITWLAWMLEAGMPPTIWVEAEKPEALLDSSYMPTTSMHSHMY